MEPNYQIKGHVIVDFMTHVTAWSLNTASRASRWKGTASRYDYHSGNGHFAYQMSFDFDENQDRFKKDQYAGNVGAGILNIYF